MKQIEIAKSFLSNLSKDQWKIIGDLLDATRFVQSRCDDTYMEQFVGSVEEMQKREQDLDAYIDFIEKIRTTGDPGPLTPEQGEKL